MDWKYPLPTWKSPRITRPSFNVLQNRATGAAIFFCVFDVMVLGGRHVMGETLATRRDLPAREVMPLLADPIPNHSTRARDNCGGTGSIRGSDHRLHGSAAREITGTPDGGNGDVRRLRPLWRLQPLVTLAAASNGDA
jgi:hypothetical protein